MYSILNIYICKYFYKKKYKYFLYVFFFTKNVSEGNMSDAWPDKSAMDGYQSVAMGAVSGYQGVAMVFFFVPMHLSYFDILVCGCYIFWFNLTHCLSLSLLDPTVVRK